jgi:surface protein
MLAPALDPRRRRRGSGRAPSAPAHENQNRTDALVDFCTGQLQYVMDDETIRTAVTLYFTDRSAADATYGTIGTWDTSGVTDMSELFCALMACAYYNSGASGFLSDISAWDTSGVTDMHGMFRGAYTFNNVVSTCNGCAGIVGDWHIGGWDVSKVTDMAYMFSYAKIFDQPIGNWRVDGVTDMKYMFGGASDFNQPIGDWCVHNVEDMKNMFYNAEAFNQDLSNWQVDKVTTMWWMFYGAEAFDQDLGWCADDDVDLWRAFDNTPCEATSCGVEEKDDASECPASLATCAALGSDGAKARSVAFGLLLVALLGAAL